MYSRNTSAKAESADGFNRYRYSMPPKYGGSRFMKQSDRVIALPDSAFSAPEEHAALPQETVETPASAAEPEQPAAAEEAPVPAGPAEHLGDLLGSIGKDDLLLAAVIVMLYAEKRESGQIDNELVLILALLLGTR